MHAAGRRYRSKIEILRDLIAAAAWEFRKTRIIGRANLNEESFSKYSGLALEHGLLGRTPIGYRATPRGQEWVHAADRVVAKRSELTTAIQDLDGLTRPGVRPHRMDDSLLGTASSSVPPLAARRPLGLPSTGGEPVGPRKFEGPLGSRPALQDVAARKGSPGTANDPDEPLPAPRRRGTRRVGDAPTDPIDAEGSAPHPRVWPSVPVVPIALWLTTLGSALGALLFGLPFDGGVPG